MREPPVRSGLYATRPVFCNKAIDVARILEIIQKAEVVIPEKEPKVSRDSKDNKFLAATEEAHADYLVSEDRDLLDLTQHQSTRIIPTHAFLRILTSKPEAA